MFSEIVDWYIDLEFEFAKAQIDAGADIIGSGEAAGFFCSPEFYVKFGLKADKKVYKKIRDYGAPVLLHCCGYVPQCIKYAPDVNAGGVIQINYNVDLAWAKSLIGDKIAIMGNLDGNRVLAAGSEEDIEKACIRAVKEAGKGGGYMLSAGCEIPRDTPNQNMAMMMKVVKTFGKYPIRVS